MIIIDILFNYLLSLSRVTRAPPLSPWQMSPEGEVAQMWMGSDVLIRGGKQDGVNSSSNMLKHSSSDRNLECKNI